MILTRNPAQDGFDDCGCCEGLTAVTPLTIDNQPGLTAIAYRVGRHGDFKKSLLAGLSTSSLAGLRRLTCRDDDDFAIALLDAWAVIADILSFYQERLANESFLATATEKLSVFELARLVGYRPKPGVAAATLLAFTLEEAPGLAPGTIPSTPVQTVPTETTIDIGIQVRSVPGPDEESQTYETVEKMVARAEWNAIKPRLTAPQDLDISTTQIFLDGTSTLLKPGDGLLLFPAGSDAPIFREVAEVIPYPQEKYSKVVLEAISGTKAGSTAQAKDKEEPSKALAGNPTKKVQATPPRVLALRLRAAIFGHNAPTWDSLPNFQKYGEKVFVSETKKEFKGGAYANRKNSWAETTLEKYHGASGSKNIYLDNAYSAIVEKSWIVLQEGGTSQPYLVDQAAELSKADFTLNAKVTRLTLASHDDFDKFHIRHTSVWAQSEELKLARRPLTSAVTGAAIALNGVVAGLSKNQKVIVGGKLSPSGQEIVCETGVIDRIEEITIPEKYTRIILKNALKNSYLRSTVTINANVLLATHGERVREILGSGNAAQGFQTFALRHAPLTYVSSDKPGGAQSTLEVRVNDLLWEEVPSLFGHGPNARIYRTFSDDQGKTLVQFGDGLTGARLPSGRENVVASYRKGLGLSGLVKPKQLSLLMKQPLGVKGVTNPLAASGADDPEQLADARQNAPLTVMTLERVVSLQDYEDYARAFGGIAKALATWFWNGRERGILLTVAAPLGNPVLKGTQVYDNLVHSLKLAGDPFLPVWVASYQPRTFRIAAKVRVGPGLITEKISKDVEARLRAHFSFESRKFGQSTALSEILAVIQTVAGVLAVDVDALHYSEAAPDPQPATLLTASLPRLGSADTILAAELLTLEPAPLALGVMP